MAESPNSTGWRESSPSQREQLELAVHLLGRADDKSVPRVVLGLQKRNANAGPGLVTRSNLPLKAMALAGAPSVLLHVRRSQRQRAGAGQQPNVPEETGSKEADCGPGHRFHILRTAPRHLENLTIL